VVLNRMWQEVGRVHHKRQKDGTLAEVRPSKLCLVTHMRQSARMITLDAKDIAVLTGVGIARPKASAKGQIRGREGEAAA
jgi:ribulose bisphosphate carboxylase small subunit